MAIHLDFEKQVSETKVAHLFYMVGEIALNMIVYIDRVKEAYKNMALSKMGELEEED